MTPEEALQILDAAAAQAALSRLGHIRVQESAQTLMKFINESKKEEGE